MTFQFDNVARFKLFSQLRWRLFLFAVGFVGLYALSITLAPYARTPHGSGAFNWQIWIGFAFWVLSAYLVERMASSSLPGRDPYILPIVFFLTGWGLMTIWRLSPSLGLRQSIWIMLSSLILITIFRLPALLEKLKKYRYIWLLFCFFLVGLTLIPVFLEKSSQPNLWLRFGSFSIQPSEALKFFFLVYLAAYFSNKHNVSWRSWPIILPSLLVLILITLLFIYQRDLGTASLILMMYALVLYLVTRQKRVLFISALFLVIAAITGYFLVDVIRYRVDAWINPWIDPTDRSFQIVQSLISIASGGFFGTGPGLGSPGLVPVSASDFIFTAIVEETGLLGGAGLITLVFILFSRSIKIASKAGTQFSSLLVSSLGLFLVLQSLLIIAGNTRLAPLTGVTLPFVSYGGTSLMISMASIGIILRISANIDYPSAGTYLSEPLRRIVVPMVIIGASALLLIISWWTILNQQRLVSRGDNLRHAITDVYILRGSILDRNSKPINSTAGETGSYSRIYHYPNLANTTGYAHISYGLAGIESSLQPYLRGFTGYSQIKLWWSNLLISQPPPGLDVRLSLDLETQSILDNALQDQIGAGVILNASTGELLAISSQPGFDPNLLQQNWEELVTDPNNPLLNRAVNGNYPLGTAAGAFIFSQAIETKQSIAGLNADPVTYKGIEITCAQPNQGVTEGIGSLVRWSCPQTNLDLAKLIGQDGLYTLYRSLGFYSPIDLPLPITEMTDPGNLSNLKAGAIGQENLTITPLHLALAASAISSDGNIPNPLLAMAYQQPSGQWVLFKSPQASRNIYSAATTRQVQKTLALTGIPAWGVVGRGLSGPDKQITWFYGGSGQNWQGSPIAIAIVLEENQPQEAYTIGQSILSQMLLQN